MPVRQCSSAHCSGADAEINEICKGEGWPVSHPVLTRDEQGPCTCSCSCHTNSIGGRSLTSYIRGKMTVASAIAANPKRTMNNEQSGKTLQDQTQVERD